MKKFLFAALILVSTHALSYSQNQPRVNKLESYKIAFITRKLNLTSEEAQRFWPIYNKYMSEVTELRKQKRDLDEINFEEKLVNIRKKYKGEFGKALTDDKANQFFQAEKEFNNTLRKELQDRLADEKDPKK